MKTIIITGKNHEKRHPVDFDVLIPAAALTVESHNLEHPEDPWELTIEDDESQADE